MDKILWTAQEVGEQINRSDREVREHFRYLEDFPVAVVLPSRKGREGHPQWVPEEVRDWVLNQRDLAKLHRKPITRN